MFHPDEQIGPYTLVRQLGRGAFGEVWLADRPSSLMTTQVALKLPIDGATDITIIRAEAHAWLQASGHPNVVPVLEAEVYNGQVVIASEYIAGGSLSEWLATNGGKAPAIESAVAMARGILAGIGHLHQNGLVHRDLKPDNVMLQSSQPRLTDFGLTIALKPAEHTADPAGSPAYMAPEAFQGRCSIASDLWAAGMMLHEMLTGSLPYPQADFFAVLLAVTGDDPVPIAPRVPEGLRQLLGRALAKDAAARFTSAAEMADALAAARAPGATAQPPVAAPPVSRIPVQTTSFVGRERDLEAVRALRSSTRLMTLTGAGGVGKTRLLVELGAILAAGEQEGVCLVDLAPISDPAHVVPAAAAAFGVREQPGEPLIDTLVDAMRPRSALLLLDNCEHLLDECARLAQQLLRGCPKLDILATSRERLNVDGETVYRVPSLLAPEPAEAAVREKDLPAALMEYAAVRLFVDRARTHHPDFALTRQNGPTVARICRRLDGIPLAIELAAARIRGMSVEAIDGRLDDRFRLLTGGSRTALARQQTLRATMDWSFDLLTAKERLLLPRLSIFAGGWTLEAAERVCPDGAIQEWEVLDGLMALVDKSLVVYDPYGRDGGRYRLLETVRQYAAERRDDPATGAKARHRDFFLELAETLEPRLKGAEQARSLEQLETEQENLRAALEYCQEEVNGAAAELRMVASLWQLWYMHGYASQGRRYLAHALNRDGAAERNERRGFVLNGAGVLAWQQGDYDSARALLNESLSIKRELNDKPGVAGAALNLGNLAYYQGDYSGARERYEESLALKRALGDRMGIALALGNIGMVAWNQGDYPTAQAQYEASRDLLRELGHEYALATVVQNLGLLARDQRDYGAARALFDESLEMRRELGDKQGISESLGHLGTVARAVKDYGAAEELYEESLSITRELGDRRGIAGCLMNLAEAATDVGELDRAAKLFEEGLELRRKLADKQGILTALEGAARLCVARGRARKAVPLWGAAEHLREEIGASLTPYDREQYERNVASAREAVEDVAFRNAWDDGRAMTIEEAIAAALDVIAG